MQLFWHGLSCVRIESSVGQAETTLVTDPYGSETGLRFPRVLKPDVLVLSHQDRDRFPLDSFDSQPFAISDPGEYEVKGLFIFGTPVVNETDKNGQHAMMYRFEVEGMSVGFLGGVTRMLNDQELGKLENIDILLVPVGDGGKLSSKHAIELINAIEPRIVVPLDHQVAGLKKELGTADAFCKEIGVCKRQDANKLKITRKDLPAEDILIAVLERA